MEPSKISKQHAKRRGLRDVGTRTYVTFCESTSPGVGCCSAAQIEQCTSSVRGHPSAHLLVRTGVRVSPLFRGESFACRRRLHIQIFFHLECPKRETRTKRVATPFFYCVMHEPRIISIPGAALHNIVLINTIFNFFAFLKIFPLFQIINHFNFFIHPCSFR